MALNPVTSADGPDAARAKINAGFTQADKVDQKADSTALAALGGSVDTVIRLFGEKAEKSALAAEATRATAAEGSLRTDLNSEVTARASEVTARTNADAALSGRIDGIVTLISPNADLVGGASDRPGDARSLFTRVMTGEPKSRAIMDRGTIVTNDDMGQALRIVGTDVDATPGFIDIAPRRAIFLRPFRTYIARFAFVRVVNPSDPSQNAVEARIQNLSSSFGQVSTARLGLFTPVQADGVVYADILIGKAGAPGNLAYTIPDTSRYGVPYLRIYGNGQTTDVGAIAVYDVTDGLLGGADVAAITARISTFEARLKAIEGATGIDATLLSGLAADRDAVRSTRYFGRPGEAIRTWTADVGATPQAATPLAVGGAYSIVSTVMGPALRIAGAASARPIAQIPLDDTQVEEFKVTIKRGVDSSTSADNAPVLSFASFKADGTSNATVGLPADPLTVAQGIRSYTFRASLVAGLGTVDLPAGTRRIDLIVGGKGTGAVDVISVERNSQSLTSAPEMTDAIASEDRLFIFDDSAKLIKKYTFAQLEAYLAPPRLYQHEIRGIVVSNESTIVLAADDLRRGEIEIQAASQCQLAVRWGGGSASFVDGGSWIQSSDWLNHNGGQGSCSIAVRAKEGDAPTVPFSTTLIIRVNRTVNVPPNALTKGDIVLGRMKDPMDPRYAAIIKKEVDDSVALGDYPKFPLWALIGSTKENCRVNIGNPTGKLFTFREGASGIPIVINPYVNLVGNAQDQNIDTTYMPADVGWTDSSHALGVRAGSAALGGANPQIASNLINVQPNRTNTDHGFSSGSQTDRVSMLGSLGKWVGLSRISTGSFRTFIDEAFSTEFARANPTVVPRSIKLMSGAGVAGSSDYSTAPFAGAFTGPGCTDAEFIRQVQRIKRIEAVGALIASGA